MEGGEEEIEEGGQQGPGILEVITSLVPLAFNIGEKFINLISDRSEKQDNNEVNRELENQISQINEQKKFYEEMNKKNEEKIENLEKMLKENLEEMKRKELEREKELLEKEQKEKERLVEELKKKEEAIKNCKKSLSKEFSKGMFKIINKFSKEEEKWLESIKDPKIQNKISILKQKLEILFDELFESEKIVEKINNKFIAVMKANVNQKELEKMNLIAIGTSGVGKSTLINEIFGEQLAKEGMGTRTTLESKKYESKLVPFLSLVDTMGTEIGSGHRLVDVLKETLEQITKKLNSNDPNEHIHCIIYCTTSNRFFKDELEVILKLREKYDGKRLPIVIVYTRATKDEEAESIKKAISEFLNEHGESLSDDIFGITFIKVNAREEKVKIFGEVNYSPCFGLANLMTTCFKKGEKSYRIAIKNSLMQIGKTKIKEYVNNISEQLQNNVNYFFYLNQAFEPNFPNYLAYCFEKLSDIENMEGISKNEIETLENYINDKKQEQKEHKGNLTENVCMVCNTKKQCPYICSFCSSLSCEECYLQQFQQKDKPRCLLCDQDLIENKNQLNNNKNDEEFNNIAKSINYMNILNSNLNLESRNSINIYTEDFKNELIGEVNEKFDRFTKEASKNLYTKVLETYTDNLRNNPNNANLQESMKSKVELKSEATTKITALLKDKAVEDFLKKNASEIYQEIVKIFNKKLIEKIDEFVNNIDKNKEAQKFFDTCDVLNDDKELKLNKEIDAYIKTLQNREEESQRKALEITYGPSQSQIMQSNQGESVMPSSPGDCGETGQCGESKINYSSGV